MFRLFIYPLLFLIANVLQIIVDLHFGVQAEILFLHVSVHGVVVLLVSGGLLVYQLEDHPDVVNIVGVNAAAQHDCKKRDDPFLAIIVIIIIIIIYYYYLLLLYNNLVISVIVN